MLPNSLTETIAHFVILIHFTETDEPARWYMSYNMQSKLLKSIEKYLKADTPSKKTKVLERKGCEGVSQQPTGNFQLNLGEEIPDNYLHRLDQSPNNVFHLYEKVGYEEKEGCIKVARVLYLVNQDAESALNKTYFILYNKDLKGKEVSIKLYKFITTHDLYLLLIYHYPLQHRVQIVTEIVALIYQKSRTES